MRQRSYETFCTERAVEFMAMATPEDMKASAEYIRVADRYVEVPAEGAVTTTTMPTSTSSSTSRDGPEFMQYGLNGVTLRRTRTLVCQKRSRRTRLFSSVFPGVRRGVSATRFLARSQLRALAYQLCPGQERGSRRQFSLSRVSSPSRTTSTRRCRDVGRTRTGAGRADRLASHDQGQ